MTSRQNDLTTYAQAGYGGASNPHIQTSPAWYAHELGRHFQVTGRPSPRDVRMGRGYSIRGNDMRFKINDSSGGTAKFERVE